MKTRSDEEEREGREKGLCGKNESHGLRYDIVLMLSQPVVIEM